MGVPGLGAGLAALGGCEGPVGVEGLPVEDGVLSAGAGELDLGGGCATLPEEQHVNTDFPTHIAIECFTRRHRLIWFSGRLWVV